MSAQYRTAKYVLLSWLGAVACNQVLGIEDARVDPTLTLGTGGRQGPSNGGADVGVGGSDTRDRGGTFGMGGNSTTQSGGTSGGMGPSNGGALGEGGAPAAGGADTGEAGAGGAPGPGSLCDQYCDVISEYCAGSALQYRDRDQCLKVCELFPQGEVAGADGNTVACRLKYASKARYAAGVELGAYCRQAGPGGDGRCGSNCEGFCTIMMGTCTPAITEIYSYPTMAACLSDCAMVPTEPPFEYGADSVADGDSLSCRLFHGISAAMADAEEHCEHSRGVTLCEPPSP